MSDPIDNFWPERTDSFEDKKFLAVTQAAGEFGKDDSLPDISVLLAAMKEALGEDVADVRATGRLTDSAVVLAADDKGPDLQVQRLMRRAGRAMMPARPILEVNPRHKLIESLVAKQDDKDLVKNVAETLLDLAKVQEGEPLKDAAGLRAAGSARCWRGVWRGVAPAVSRALRTSRDIRQEVRDRRGGEVLDLRRLVEAAQLRRGLGVGIGAVRGQFRLRHRAALQRQAAHAVGGQFGEIIRFGGAQIAFGGDVQPHRFGHLRAEPARQPGLAEFLMLVVDAVVARDPRRDRAPCGRCRAAGRR